MWPVIFFTCSYFLIISLTVELTNKQQFSSIFGPQSNSYSSSNNLFPFLPRTILDPAQR